MKKLITTLTPDQEALIRVYRKKWHTIAHSTQPINRQKATEAIQLAYNLMGDPNPEIVFCESPYAAFDILLSVIWQRWESKDDYGHRHIFGDRWQLLRKQLELQITDKLCEEIDGKIREDTDSSLTEESLKPEELWSHILYSQIEEKWQ